MKLVLGDWSEDGHGISDEVIVHVNYSVTDVQNAYKAACKKTGISFNHNDDFTEIERDYDERRKYHIATEYEQGLWDFSGEVADILALHRVPPPTDDGDPIEEYVKLWFNFVRIILPDLSYTIDEPEDIPAINGYWNNNLNVQFGYGLYQ